MSEMNRVISSEGLRSSDTIMPDGDPMPMVFTPDSDGSPPQFSHQDIID